MPILVATDREVVVIDVERGTSVSARGIGDRPTCLAADTLVHGRAWCGTHRDGVFRTDDGGLSWRPVGVGGRLVMAIEAGALVSTIDGGRTWLDRVAGGPWDTHELAVHRNAPDTLRVSAGDGYFESDDAGATWRSPSTGLEVGYLRSVAIDPGQPQVVVVSASSGPYTAYVAGRSDGRLYRRLTPERPSTWLGAGAKDGEIWAADGRGVHRSDDSGKSWRRVVGYATSPQHLRGLALLQ